MNCTTALLQYTAAEDAIPSRNDPTNELFYKSRCNGATFGALFNVFNACPTMKRYPSLDPGIGDGVESMLGFCQSKGITWSPPEEPKGLAASTIALLTLAILVLPTVAGVLYFLRRKAAVRRAEKEALDLIHQQNAAIVVDGHVGDIETRSMVSHAVPEAYAKQEAHAMAERMVRAEEAKKEATKLEERSKRAKKDV
ncbi:hypothetical protein BDR26DRAFT_920745, partial [Obelidium mucronatum]